MEINDSRVPYLIFRYKCGRISPDEQEELDRWVAGNPENKKIFHEVLGVNVSQKYAKWSSVNSRMAWKELDRIIRKKIKAKRSRLLLRVSSGVVAAIAVLVLIVWAGLFRDMPAISGSDVMPGERKAVLELADGTGISLNDRHSDIIEQENVLITIQDGEIVYSDITPQSSDVYNAVIVPRGGEYKLRLPDGTLVWLNSASHIKYPLSFTGGERIISFQGEGYFEVRHDRDRPFIIETADQRLTVLGTEFNLSAYDDDTRTITTLVGGSVEISSKLSRSSITLMPGQQSRVDAGSGLLTIADVNTDIFTSWKNGFINIEGNTLGEVLSKLSRWYDVDFNIKDDGIKGIVFEGDITRDSNLSSVISTLEKACNVKFRLNDKIIEVRAK